MAKITEKTSTMKVLVMINDLVIDFDFKSEYPDIHAKLS